MIELPDGLDLDFSETQKQLGIKTKATSITQPNGFSDYEAIKASLEEQDRKQFITRYKWYMTPNEILDTTIENMIFHEGTLMFFYMPELEEFFFLPPNFIENQGQLMNPMGEYYWAYPRAFRGTQELRKDQPAKGKSRTDLYLQTIIKKVVHHIPYVKTTQDALSYINDSCVLLHDSTPANGSYSIPRVSENKTIIELLTQAYIQLDTAIMNSSGFQLYNVRPEEADSMAETLRAIARNRRRGSVWGVSSTNLEAPVALQNAANTASMIEIMNTIQSLDNFRLATMGVQNDGILQKSQYKNILQQAQSSASTTGIFRDGLKQREKFCAIANSIWGLNMFVGEDKTEEQIMNEQKAEEGGNDVDNEQDIY